MIKKRILLLCLITVMTVSFSGCGKAPGPAVSEPEPAYEKGLWDGDIYTNAFFGFSFEKDEAMEVMGDDTDQYFPETEAVFDPSRMSADHPFLIDTALKDSRHRLCLIVLVTQPGQLWGVEMTKEDCAAEFIGSLGTEEPPETDTVTLFGKEFIRFTVGDPETVYNSCYVGEKNGSILIFVCSVYESQKPDMNGFMQSIVPFGEEEPADVR